MIIYFLFFLICIILAFLSTKVKSKYSKTLKLIIFLALFLFSGLRYDVGFDYSYTYVPGYYFINSNVTTHFEPAYILLNKFVYMVFNNIDFVFLICSFITIYLLIKSIEEESDDYFISIIMIFCSRFYLYSFGQIRQYIAIAIFIYSIKYIIKKDIKKYFLLILLAMTFHKTAVIYFPVYFLNKIKLSRSMYVLCILVSPLFKPFFNFIYQFLGTRYYQSYIDLNYGVNNWSIVLTATAIILTIFPIIFYNNIVNTEKGKVLLNLQLLLCILIMTISGINESYRIIGMFMYSSIFLIATCYKLSSKKFKFVMLVLLLSISLYSSYLMLIKDGTKMIPYKTILNK